MLILVFAVRLNLVTPAGKGNLSTYVLPAVTLALPSAAGMTRLIRSSMLEVLSSDFIQTARSKGLSEFAVTRQHALRNALIPATTYGGLVLVRHTIMGSIVIETVFGWPGIGRLAYEATFTRDYPVVQGLVVIFAIVVVAVNIGLEILYGFLDPRIGHK
jgi:ABC-type dipeptide/oligopeptide/nickel transport system permease component